MLSSGASRDEVDGLLHRFESLLHGFRRRLAKSGFDIPPVERARMAFHAGQLQQDAERELSTSSGSTYGQSNESGTDSSTCRMSRTPAA